MISGDNYLGGYIFENEKSSFHATVIIESYKTRAFGQKQVHTRNQFQEGGSLQDGPPTDGDQRSIHHRAVKSSEDVGLLDLT